jgi:DNA-binding PadR family transcriptional regulator
MTVDPADQAMSCSEPPLRLDEGIVLCLVRAEPKYGYEIKREHDQIFHSPRALQFGQLYKVLGRLHSLSLIEALPVESGQGPKRTPYRATSTGLCALQEWLLTPDEDENWRQVVTKTLLAIHIGEPTVSISAYLTWHAERRESMLQGLDFNNIDNPDLLYVRFREQAELAWARTVLERLGVTTAQGDS